MANAAAVEVYLKCADQWRQHHGGGVWLANGDILAAMQAMQIDPADHPALFDDVKIIIGEIATQVQREQRDK
jgi:hypothetical protein